MENAEGILIFTVIVIGFVAICGLLCFIAYRLIKKIPGKYVSETGQAERGPIDIHILNSRRKYRQCIDEAQAQRTKMMQWVRQAEETSRQKAKENDRQIISDIKTKARREISRELDSAVGEIHKEYNSLTASGNEAV